MLLINHREEVDWRGQEKSDKKYPTKASEGNSEAAGPGLPAKGLINDSSVV